MDSTGCFPSSPHGQIDRIFALAREFNVDIDMHLDFGHTSDEMDIEHVCNLTEEFGYGGQVTVGHVTKMSTISSERFFAIAQRLANVGVAVTVLPSTDLYLMGRHQDQNIIRGVTPAHKLMQRGVICSLSTNNVLNPFTPFGDCSLIRMANLYANICQVDNQEEVRACFDMVTQCSAQILG